MAREKEIKIKLVGLPLDKFTERITNKGFYLTNTLDQLDIYFDTKDWYLYKNMAALRLRKIDDKYELFTFKKVFYVPNNTNNYFVEEIEVKAPFKDIKSLKDIFSRLELDYNNIEFQSGSLIIDFLRKQEYFDEQKMSKVRKVYKRGSNELVIDTVDKVGVIIELECKKDEPLDLVRTFLDDSEWERDLEGTSYAWLKRVKGFSEHDNYLKKFQENPKWNVWYNEQGMYRKLIEN
ncbi:hypothetical protein A2863_04015 [Candidatus Woesebacteria bacterium RIFCSPHIGHO2_01_FULL_38_9b]|uniref:CYTH domain-containing protein n=1 Tax=Candidatus Woesebacteria bacterium RIFCSPHIGHO2_01_FULL_38_9b TaxID=1802493 RepID=A0A1F7Y2Q0_9BACT|nr:MAG: hypothetical protein A2863_04015 [Candidatus Woesebacteria bacterium RIFCSPHIGHO2_01_FULL_38_9b]